MPAFWSMALPFLSTCVGWAVFSLVAHPAVSSRDGGVKAFLFPLVSLNLFSFFGVIAGLASLTGADPSLFAGAARCVRLTHGIAWVMFCRRQFKLHGVAEYGRWLTVPLLAITALNVFSYVSARSLGLAAEPTYRVNVLVMSMTAFYAAFTAFSLPARASDILPSAWTGLWIAGISVIAYPLAVASDVFGYRYPLFDGNRMVWEQVFPVYFLAVNGFILRMLVSGPKPAESAVPVSALTKREEDVIRLLAARKSYKDISAELQISLSTVKTHVANAYRKLGISSFRKLPVTDRRDYPEIR